MSTDERTREMRVIARNAAWMVASILWPALAMAVSVPVFYHYLGPEDFGLWVVANAILGAMGLLSFGMGEATMKYVAECAAEKQEQDVTRVFVATMILYVSFGVIGTIVLYAAADVLAVHAFDLTGDRAQRGVAAIRVVALGFLPSIGLLSVNGYFEGYQRFGVSRVLVMARYAGVVVLGIVVLALGMGIVELMVSMVAVLWCVCAVGFAIAVRGLRWIPLGEWRLGPTFARVTRFGVWSMVMGMGQRLSMQADKIVLGALIGLDVVAYYSIPQTVVFKVASLARAVSKTLVPYFSAREATEGRGGLASGLVKSWRLSIVVGLGAMAGVAGCAQSLLALWMGRAFAQAAIVPMIVLLVGSAVAVLHVVPTAYLLGTGRPAGVAVYTTVGGLANLGAMYLLAPRYGVVGGAVSSFAFSLVMLGVCRVVAREANAGKGSVGRGLGGAIGWSLAVALSGAVAGAVALRAVGVAWVGFGASVVVSGAVGAGGAILLGRRGDEYFGLLWAVSARLLGKRGAAVTRRLGIGGPRRREGAEGAEGDRGGAGRT